MLIVLLMLVTLITQVLNQTHQQVLAQAESRPYSMPPDPRATAHACLMNRCPPHAALIRIAPLSNETERQFYSATIQACDNHACHLITQVFSRDSAILNGGIAEHALTVTRAL